MKYKKAILNQLNEANKTLTIMSRDLQSNELNKVSDSVCNALKLLEHNIYIEYDYLSADINELIELNDFIE